MEVLASRILIHPTDIGRAREFYEDVLGLGIYHEYAQGGVVIGVVYFAGGGFIELAETVANVIVGTNELWLQVRDLRSEQARLIALGVEFKSEAERKPWGLIEANLVDPDGNSIVLVEVPRDHFLRTSL